MQYIPDLTHTIRSRSSLGLIKFDSGSSSLHISKAQSLSAIVQTQTSKRLRPLAVKYARRSSQAGLSRTRTLVSRIYQDRHLHSIMYITWMHTRICLFKRKKIHVSQNHSYKLENQCNKIRNNVKKEVLKHVNKIESNKTIASCVTEYKEAQGTINQVEAVRDQYTCLTEDLLTGIQQQSKFIYTR